MKMSNQTIAELVHNLVKDPTSILSREHFLPPTELKTNEVTIIQRVFSEVEVSGNALTLGTLPLGFWG